jgi:CRP/FNR family transcriptional regulator, cyclic AMP receptor protein
MLSTNEKVLALRTVPIFAELPMDQLSQVAMLMEEVDLATGETLFEQGDMGDCLYVIVTGKMRIHQDEHTLAYLEEHEIFGEMALLAAAPRVAGATAAADSLLLRLDQAPVYELLEGNSTVIRGIMQVLTRYLHRVTADIDRLQ